MQTLLRIFYKIGGHHSGEDFAVRGKEPKDQFQIYTWKDATLRELTTLIKELGLASTRRDARLSFAFVCPDKNGRFVVREVGRTLPYPYGRRRDYEKTLTELGFEVKQTAFSCYRKLTWMWRSCKEIFNRDNTFRLAVVHFVS
ncbi:hypothetical protein Patl1_00403 [Pistacia atlantica]|uniref:Uncharacterized protein n=1 Tax=Pistacia atlantica TaxID=434234 RepID=A0ACC1C419_9ROSI|nr:hypothetical protein Patl1_00403 [Pistacia atlantica]